MKQVSPLLKAQLKMISNGMMGTMLLVERR
jgi:hypothetical protein